VHLLVSELYIYQNERCNNKNLKKKSLRMSAVCSKRKINQAATGFAQIWLQTY